VVKEFEDLGSSVRMKKVEEALSEQKEDSECSQEGCKVIKLFRTKGHSFPLLHLFLMTLAEEKLNHESETF
jgi:hypothetical protein